MQDRILQACEKAEKNGRHNGRLEIQLKNRVWQLVDSDSNVIDSDRDYQRLWNRYDKARMIRNRLRLGCVVEHVRRRTAVSAATC